MQISMTIIPKSHLSAVAVRFGPGSRQSRLATLIPGGHPCLIPTRLGVTYQEPNVIREPRSGRSTEIECSKSIKFLYFILTIHTCFGFINAPTKQSSTFFVITFQPENFIRSNTN